MDKNTKLVVRKGVGYDHLDTGSGETVAYDLEEENARRIVAAVNACAGISTEQLENPPNSTQLFASIAGRLTSNNMKLRDDLSDVTAQRDQLLAELEAIIEIHDSARRGSDVAATIANARAAIAAVKGD